MAAPARPPRPRSGGGRTLMLLGVLLALAAGTIVIYIVSQATGGGTQKTTVVVAKIDLPANTVLSSSPSQKDATHTLISDAFVSEDVPVDVAPIDAYKWISQADLDSKLNNYVVTGQFLKGEFLRNPDRRLTQLGTGGAGSLTNINPPQLPDGSVLFAVDVHGVGGGAAKPLAVPGDYVDFIFIECQLPNSKDPNGCESQTTLQNIYVYAVADTELIVVLTHQQAVAMLYLENTGVGKFVIRKPSDHGTITTLEVDRAYIVKNFGY